MSSELSRSSPGHGGSIIRKKPAGSQEVNHLNSLLWISTVHAEMHNRSNDTVKLRVVLASDPGSKVDRASAGHAAPTGGLCRFTFPRAARAAASVQEAGDTAACGSVGEGEACRKQKIAMSMDQLHLTLSLGGCLAAVSFETPGINLRRVHPL